MNDSELNRILKSAETPRRNDEYWSGFPGQVARQLKRPLPSQHRATGWWPRLAWAGGFATVCVVVGFIVGHQSGRNEMANGNGQLLQSEKLIREVMATFPNRVRAIVKNDSGMQIVLSDSEDIPASTPLWVKVCQGEHCTTLVTFSGQEVEVAGQKMTVLSDAEGGVILTGDRFVWASEDPNAGVQDLKIQAKPLQMASR
jgi:hypothetical protein